jgi:hypothetical protein
MNQIFGREETDGRLAGHSKNEPSAPTGLLAS